MKLTSKLPGGEGNDRNGLLAIYDALTGHPDRQHVVVAVIDSNKTEIDHDARDARIPHVRIRHIEVMGSDLEAAVAFALLDRTYSGRTGALPAIYSDLFGGGTIFDTLASETLARMDSAARGLGLLAATPERSRPPAVPARNPLAQCGLECVYEHTYEPGCVEVRPEGMVAR